MYGGLDERSQDSRHENSRDDDMKTLNDYLYYESPSGLGKLYCGDCLEILPLIEDEIDFCFADPPYGVKKAEWDREYFTGFEELIESKCKGGEITPGDNSIGICISKLKSYKGVMHNFNKNGMTFNSVGFENVITGVMFGKFKRGQNYIQFTVSGDKPEHESPKPIEMLFKTVSRFSNKSDLILDPFLGSGTTAVACEKLGRRWIGIEISQKYCEIAKKRIDLEALQGKLF